MSAEINLPDPSERVRMATHCSCCDGEATPVALVLDDTGCRGIYACGPCGCRFLVAMHDSRDEPVAEDHPSTRSTGKLSGWQVITIRERHAGGASRSELAADYGVSVGTIGNVVNRRTWAWLP